MPSIRRARLQDLHEIQNCNLWCLPENYYFQYYLYHYLTWSSLIHVAEENGEVVGYVLAKMDDESNEKEGDLHGHITSVSVLRTHRRLGLAKKVMDYAHDSMEKVQDGKYISLHVRVSNRAALGLYRDRLKYQVHDRVVGYYADGEDAFEMRKELQLDPAAG